MKELLHNVTSGLTSVSDRRMVVVVYVKQPHSVYFHDKTKVASFSTLEQSNTVVAIVTLPLCRGGTSAPRAKAIRQQQLPLNESN